MVLNVMLVPLVVFWAIGHEEYLLSALIDLPHPSNYAAEGYRVLWTLCGVGIGVLVMFIAGLLARRSAKTPPQSVTQPA
jgi:hypothetical protein